MKRILALILCFVMVFSLVAVAEETAATATPTATTEFSDVPSTSPYKEAISTLTGLGIILGDAGSDTFRPEAGITRAEFCAVVCRALGFNQEAAPTATAFSDVPAEHWASGFVVQGVSKGYINGMGDGTFAPEANIKYEQAVKMVVSALGFDPMAASKGGWPTGYLVVANTYKITEGVSNSTRADVAILIYNALSTPMMDQTTWGADAEFEKEITDKILATFD